MELCLARALGTQEVSKWVPQFTVKRRRGRPVGYARPYGLK